MDIHSYYQRIRAQQQLIDGEYVWVTSEASRNGGVGGRVCEVSAKVAAKMLVDGMARLATDAEVCDERAQLEAKNRRANASMCTSYLVSGNDS